MEIIQPVGIYDRNSIHLFKDWILPYSLHTHTGNPQNLQNSISLLKKYLSQKNLTQITSI